MTDDKKQIVVSLKDAVLALDTMSDELQSYLNLKTGEWVTLSNEVISIAKDDRDINDSPEWEQEMIIQARDVLETDDYLQLPDRYEINEYSIMEEFIRSLNGRIRDNLLDQICGKGAFGRFKNAIHRYGIEDQWFEFREKALEKIVIAWLEENNIRYIS
jgi:hypothetical protein